MHAIEVTGVSKTFFVPSVRRNTVREHVLDFFRSHPVEKLPILREVGFTVRQGETLGIMGRNGCGKSTLLKIISGIYQPDLGHVTVHGGVTPILELGTGWNPELDAIDNIFLIGSVMGLGLQEIRGGLDEILAFAQLERFASLKLQHYSSGMAARLAYSIAFKAVRDVLILDEIFAVGDVGFQSRCMDRFKELRSKGHSIILVSHSPAIIGSYCDRAILLEDGRIQLDSTPENVSRLYVERMSHASPAQPESTGVPA